MKIVDLGDLMGETPLRRGTWFLLLDEDTQFSDRRQHPWVFPDGWDPSGRGAFGHALPRSTSPPRDDEQDGIDYMKHQRHGTCSGKPCRLDMDAWIRPIRYQVPRAWVINGSYVCEEPSSAVLGRIQTFDMEQAR